MLPFHTVAWDKSRTKQRLPAIVRAKRTGVRLLHEAYGIYSGVRLNRRVGRNYNFSPQSLQNLLPSGFTALQWEHFLGSNDWPHEGQNFASRATWVLQ